MATDWIMIRVDRSTHARLEAVRRSMQLAEEMNLRELVHDARERVSLDQIISELIYFRQRHAERRRAANVRRRKRKAHQRTFDRTWDQLAERGQCDGRGGAEYRRVLNEWFPVAGLVELVAFIRERANAASEVLSAHPAMS